MELIVIAVVGVLIFVRLSRRRGADPGALHGPVGWSVGTDWGVVMPLARADARFVLTHPAFVVGVVLTPLMLYWSTSTATDWREASTGTALALVPLGWFTIVATNLVAWRPRRTDSEELFAALPAPGPVRTAALLAAGAAPVIVAAVITAGWVSYLATKDDSPTGSPEWAEIAAGLAIVAGSVCVGVAVARWLPSPGFGVVAAVATIVIQARFLDVTTWPWDRGEGDPLRFLGFLADRASVEDSYLEIRPAAWHLLYLVGLVVLMAGVALARDGVRRQAAVLLAFASLTVVVAGWQQTRPASAAQEAEMVSYLTDPESHQLCEEWAGVSYCAYPGFVADIATWRKAVEPTLAMLPPPAVDRRAPLTVRQRPAIIVSNEDCVPVRFDGSLPPGVLERVSPAALWPVDGLVHPAFSEESFPCSEREVHGYFLAVQTSAWAVGLPPAPHGDNQRCTADGQARSVIALWAGAAAVPDGGRTLGDVVAEGSVGPSIVFAEWDDPPMWGVDYAVADAQLALTLLERPAAEVQAVLGRDWNHWIDPHTSTSELAEQFAIERSGTATASTCP
ncbi:MAG TPA: hypothetical protein VMM60_10180 [Ilumatobacter sp.]|nr:hypothetical protein [Ilumatobacter sp.]